MQLLSDTLKDNEVNVLGDFDKYKMDRHMYLKTFTPSTIKSCRTISIKKISNFINHVTSAPPPLHTTF